MDTIQIEKKQIRETSCKSSERTFWRKQHVMGTTRDRANLVTRVQYGNEITDIGESSDCMRPRREQEIQPTL